MQSDNSAGSTESDVSEQKTDAVTHSGSGTEHSNSVAKLYDKLFSFEVKKAKGAYPIHKKLDFVATEYSSEHASELALEQAEPGVADIYHWLGTHLPLADYSDILDAGCGVGFGCQTLTQYSSGRISGISLSADEVSQAKSFASEAGLSHLHFAQHSFEELSAHSYDCILMVESLKHCSDLDKAMQSLAGALKSGGAVYVVEDVYYEAGYFPQQTPVNTEGEQKLDQQLCLDWHLKKLWGLSDFRQSAERAGLDLTLKWDLTLLMPTQIKALLKAKIALFSGLSRVSASSVYPVYRGGFILDWLYAHNKMRYQVLELKKQVRD